MSDAPEPSTFSGVFRTSQNFFSIGHLSLETGYPVPSLMAGCSKLQLRPVCLDRVPILSAEETERLLEYMTGLDKVPVPDVKAVHE